jgi:broad specificity phosphatase PhoE
MTTLLLVKHSRPQIAPEVPAPRWVLSDAGRQRCEELGRTLAGLGVMQLFSSLEPKALETASLVAARNGLTVTPRYGLQENDRTGQGFLPDAELLDRIRRFFAEPDVRVMGDETADEAFARSTAAIAAIAAEARGQTAAVVTHGTVLALFVSRYNAIAPFDLWSSLKTPSCVVLDAESFAFDGKVFDFSRTA